MPPVATFCCLVLNQFATSKGLPVPRPGRQAACTPACSDRRVDIANADEHVAGQSLPLKHDQSYVESIPGLGFFGSRWWNESFYNFAGSQSHSVSLIVHSKAWTTSSQDPNGEVVRLRSRSSHWLANHPKDIRPLLASGKTMSQAEAMTFVAPSCQENYLWYVKGGMLKGNLERADLLLS